MSIKSFLPCLTLVFGVWATTEVFMANNAYALEAADEFVISGDQSPCVNEAVPYVATGSHGCGTVTYVVLGGAEGVDYNTLTTAPNVQVFRWLRAGAYQVKATFSSCAVGEVVKMVDITVNNVPTTLPVSSLPTINSYEGNRITIAVPNYYAVLDWYETGSTELINRVSTLVFPNGLAPGTHSYTGKLPADCPGDGIKSVEVTVSVTGLVDLRLNRIEANTYDDKGLVGSVKSYVDAWGTPLQAQQKSLSEKQVISSQVVRDVHSRPLLTSLPAPTGIPGFSYKSDLLVNEAGSKFRYQDLNSSGKVGNTTRGTIGWYYSQHNDMEENVPHSDFPYTRVDYFPDGTNEVRYVAGAGEIMRMGGGAGAELVSRTHALQSELEHYYTLRSQILPGTYLTRPDGTVTIQRDANKHYSMQVVDETGHLLMTANVGTPTDYDLKLLNRYLTASLRDYNSFYVMSPDPIEAGMSSTPGYHDVIDLLHDEVVKRLTPGVNVLEPGFYVACMRATLTNLRLSIPLYLKDIAYRYYDDVGKLVAEISPNSMRKILKDGVAPQDVAKATYTYNFKGWLLETSDPDQGKGTFQYRRDGRLRFSQNALQSAAGRFSFTHYDQIGRPIESGEYNGSSHTYAALSSQLEYFSQIYFSVADVKDWLKVKYDLPDDHATTGFNAVTGLSESIYGQRYVRGVVSATENANIRTWYSYDEMGRVTWMAQKPNRMPYIFVVKYTYDFLGNVLKVANLTYAAPGTPGGGSNTPTEEFYHHYEYDADKRLSKAYTSTTDTGEKYLRASYEYYLHGPLKRIELGNKTQGVDFVYNIQGWLRQINHPDPLQDPGHDTNDAFGMVLDYYESDMNNLFPSAGVVDPYRSHSVPAMMRATTMAHAPLLRFLPELQAGISTQLLTPKEYSADNPVYQQLLQHPTLNPANR